MPSSGSGQPFQRTGQHELPRTSKHLNCCTVRDSRYNMDYFDLMKGFLLSPVETFRKVRDTDLGDSLKYYLVLLVINAVFLPSWALPW